MDGLNKACLKFLNKKNRGDVIGLSLPEHLITPDSANELTKVLQDVLKTGDEKYDVEVTR